MMPKRVTGRHVLFGMLGFFGVIVAVNAVFVYLALNTFTGLSEPDAYRKGLDYNQNLAEAEKQRALGWKVKVGAVLDADGEARIRVEAADRNDAALSGLRLNGTLRRPTNEGFDQEVEFRAIGAGRYAADLQLPLRGQWDLDLVAEDAAGHRYRQEQRLWLN